MQQRYYDPVIGRFYSNDQVDMLGHMQRGNPVHGFELTGAHEMENIDASGAVTNAVVNTAAGNIADNTIGVSGTKTSALFVGAVEGARKVAEELLKDDYFSRIATN